MSKWTLSALRSSAFAVVVCLCLAPVDNKKAVFETSETDGFKVSAIGLKNLEVASQPIVSPANIVIPYGALVFLKDKVGIYRLRGEWYKLIFVDYERKGSTEAVIHSKELTAGDSLVVKGAAQMRVAESDAFGGEG